MKYLVKPGNVRMLVVFTVACHNFVKSILFLLECWDISEYRQPAVECLQIAEKVARQLEMEEIPHDFDSYKVSSVGHSGRIASDTL
jgi:hypothetical protein